MATTEELNLLIIDGKLSSANSVRKPSNSNPAASPDFR